MQVSARRRIMKRRWGKEWRRRLGNADNKGTGAGKYKQQRNRSETLPTTKEQERNIANNKGTGAKHCQQQRNRSVTLPTTKEQEQNIANNKGTGAGVASTGFLLPRAPHVVVARPVVGLEVRVLRFELEGARLGLECACLLVKGGGLLAIQSLCQRHVRTVLM